MAKERLSRIQKWILVEIYRSFSQYYDKDPLERYMDKRDIYLNYYGAINLHTKSLGGFDGSHEPYKKYDNPESSLRAKRAKPAILVSLRGLENKALIRRETKGRKQRTIYRNLYLTPTGVEMARKILGEKADLKRIKNPIAPKVDRKATLKALYKK